MLEYFEIRLEPWMFPGRAEERVLKIRVKVNGQERHLQKVVRPSDMESMFDLIFEEAKTRLEEAIVNGE